MCRGEAEVSISIGGNFLGGSDRVARDRRECRREGQESEEWRARKEAKIKTGLAGKGEV